MICSIASFSAPSIPNGGYAHSEMGNLSAIDSSDGIGSGAVGNVSLPVSAVPSQAM
jgi:hypothetical protein